MTHRRRTTTLAACLTVCAVTGRAQSRSVRVDRYTVDDGLAQNHVTATVQDRVGFLWIGTRRGLQRFDGRRFVDFAALVDPGQAPPELSDWILGILADNNGELWVATAAVLFRIDPVTRRIWRIPMQKDMAAWAPDSASQLWYFDGTTLKRLDTRADNPAPVVVADLSTLTSSQWSPAVLATSRDDGLWVAAKHASQFALLRLDPQSKQVEVHAAAGLGRPLCLLADHAGSVWLGTETGLAVVPSGKRVLHEIETFRGRRTAALVPDGRTGFFVATDLWLAHLDANGRVLERLTPRDAFGGSELPTALAIDREGAFWVSTVTKGLLRLGLERNAFSHFSSRSSRPVPFADDVVMALLERRDGTLWVGTLSGGAYRISPDWGRVDAFRHRAGRDRSLPSDAVWDFAEDRAGNLWIATSGGLCELADERLRCRRVQGGGLIGLVADPSGYLWMIGPASVVAFDPARRQFVDSIGSVGHGNDPIVLYDDPADSALWLAGHGVLRARVNRGRVVEAPRALGNQLERITTYALHRGRDGRMWRGTEAGLDVLDPVRGRFLHVPAPELTNTTVYSIAEDSAGRLWLGTARGLVFYSPASGISRRFGRREGFLSGELNRRAALRRRDGSLLFGGVDGLTQFKPEEVVAPHDASPVVLTRWRRFDAAGVVDAPIDGVRQLRLGPSDDAFTVEFAALSFAPRVDRRYRYRLEGAQSGWIETSEPVATFSRPRAGDYVLRVQTTTGADGAWGEPGAVAILQVTPPFWDTSWFELLVGLSVIAALMAAHRLRLRRALAVEQLRLRISRDLHDDIGAGLSSIALMSDALRTRGTSTETQRTQLTRISATARGMVGDLRDIIWAIDPDRDRVDNVLTRMKDVATDLLPGVRLSFTTSPSDQLSSRIGMIQRRELLLVYKEILHNIAKHAGATAVMVELHARAGELVLRVADDGPGVRDDRAGNGTGFKSLRERAARLGGAVNVRTAPLGGTIVELVVKTT